jgi:putative peptide zinc metalloprotease protein
MGMGIYMVWPAFYTDVTDSYRLPRRDRLRVDLGGIYFNALVAVATFGVWLLWRRDALLLLIALQQLMIVKNLSPVIRSDGYHILADATGVPDLYAHLGPTLRRLIPGRRREASALRGRSRALVTAWVLLIVPVLLSMLAGAVLILPRLLTISWDSGRQIVSAMPHESAAGDAASVLRLFALALPLLGSLLVTQRLLRAAGGKALAWSEGSPPRRALVAVVAFAALAGTAWALWPSGQYRPVRPTDAGTLVSFRSALASPASVARPQPVAATATAAATTPVRVAPGKHLAVAMIPVGGASRQHPALFVIPGKDGQPAVAILSTSADPVTTDPTVTTTTATPTTATTPATDEQPVAATALPFVLPAKPGPGGTQAVAVNTTDGSVKYTVAYALVTISDGANVTNTNSAFALASCKACTTVAVSFQVVLIVGTSKAIAPIDAAGALNVNCPACVTTAIADQMVITLKSQPTPELVQKIDDALKQLDALPSLGANGTPAAVAAVVSSVQKQIETALADSGQVANPPATTTTATTTRATTTAPAVTTTAPRATTTTSTTTTTPAVSPQTTQATTTTSASTTTTAPSTTTTATTTSSTTTTTTTTATQPTTTTTTTTTTGG